MVDTFRLMSQIRQECYNKMSNEELAQRFKETNNQSLLAELFCKNFALYSGVVYESKYCYIDNACKVSSVLTAICNAAYAFDSNKGYVFNTLAIKCIKQEFAVHIAKLSYKKRKDRVKDVSFEGLCELYSKDDSGDNGNSREPEYLVGVSEIQYNLIDTLNAINNSNLTKEEKIMCKAIIEDCNITNNELADILNCHRHTVRAIKQSLQTKLVSVFS